MNSVKLKTLIEREITKFSNECYEYASDAVYIANNRRNLGIDRQLIEAILRLFKDSYNQAIMSKMDSFLTKLDPIVKQIDDAEEVSIPKPSFSVAPANIEPAEVAKASKRSLTMNL